MRIRKKEALPGESTAVEPDRGHEKKAPKLATAHHYPTDRCYIPVLADLGGGDCVGPGCYYEKNGERGIRTPVTL